MVVITHVLKEDPSWISSLHNKLTSQISRVWRWEKPQSHSASDNELHSPRPRVPRGRDYSEGVSWRYPTAKELRKYRVLRPHNRIIGQIEKRVDIDHGMGDEEERTEEMVTFWERERLRERPREVSREILRERPREISRERSERMEQSEEPRIGLSEEELDIGESGSGSRNFPAVEELRPYSERGSASRVEEVERGVPSGAEAVGDRERGEPRGHQEDTRQAIDFDEGDSERRMGDQRIEGFKITEVLPSPSPDEERRYRKGLGFGSHFNINDDHHSRYEELTRLMPERQPHHHTIADYIPGQASKKAKDEEVAKINGWGDAQNIKEALSLNFKKRVFEFGFDQMLYYDKNNGVQKLNIGGLQRIVLHAQQKVIAQRVENMIGLGGLDDDFDDLQILLQGYDIRNLDYMKEVAKRSTEETKDPFLITSQTTLGTRILQECGLIDRRRGEVAPGQDILLPQMPGGTGTQEINSARLHDLGMRLGMAVFGGAALLGPMLIMILKEGKTTNLVTTCVSVFIFALAIALWWDDAKPNDIMGAVAAYAAVLVVFVGVSS